MSRCRGRLKIEIDSLKCSARQPNPNMVRSSEIYKNKRISAQKGIPMRLFAE